MNLVEGGGGGGTVNGGWNGVTIQMKSVCTYVYQFLINS